MQEPKLSSKSKVSALQIVQLCLAALSMHTRGQGSNMKKEEAASMKKHWGRVSSYHVLCLHGKDVSGC